MDIRRKFWSLLSPRKWPGHAVWILGAVWKFLDIGGRLDLFSRIVESMGGSAAMLASLLLSPWTSVGLIVGGLGYVVFVGEPGKGTQRHHWWPYVGWAIFAVTLLSMVFIAGYGSVEIYIRREIAKGVAGIPRDTQPDSTTPPQSPVYSDSRELKPNQVRILLGEFDKLKPIMSSIRIDIPHGDSEAFMLRSQYDDALRRARINPLWGELNPRSINDVGMMIAVKNTSDPPIEAQKFREALEVANIHVQYIDRPAYPDSNFEFVIFPRPLN
jgi:hypothetical protein